MEVYFGGAYQGKLDYVCSKKNMSVVADGADCNIEDLENAEILNHMHLLIKRYVKEGKSTEYFCYLLENRIFAVLFFILTGLTGAAHFIVVAAAAWMGFLAGAVGSLLILELGLEGFLIFAGSLFPQAFVYFPAVALLMTKIYKEGGNIWKKPVKVIRIYFLTGLIAMILCLSGVVFEAYIHPVWMRWILGRLC